MYHWIRSLSHEPVSIYTFRPHGSTNINDLNLFAPIDTSAIAPEIVCHDQEPLNFDIYQSVDIFEWWQELKKSEMLSDHYDSEIKSLVPYYQNLNFFGMLRLRKSKNIFDRYILLHSEKNSKDVEKFSCTAEPVYYWSHAIIARDWYRFAEHDTRLNMPSTHTKTFLIYCRAWTGTREYRLKFLDLLLEQNLLDHCQTSILHQDQGFELSFYKCVNTEFQPNNLEQLNSISDNNYPSYVSADYSANDFVSTDISVVLETIAADSKIHLTEKTLRPIACGHPFILVAGPGSLEYLKSYGFKTFSPWINEGYDLEDNVVERMKLITREMQKIENLPPFEKQQMLTQMQEIATYNKNYFFSKQFFDKVHNELVDNLNSAVDRVKITRGQRYLESKVITKPHLVKQKNVAKKLKKIAIAKVLRQLRQDPTVSLKKIIDQYPDGFFNF